MTKIEEIIEKGLMPSNIENLDLRKNTGIFVKIAVLSETISHLIIRNNDATETTSEEFAGEERVVIPASKWRGAERSFILSWLRKMDDIIPKDYERNAVQNRKLLKNPVSLLFGDSSTGKNKEATSIASRNYYDWSISLEPLAEITERLVHNSLSDSGTILMNEQGEVQSNAIYNTQYIKPGVKFVRFITLENVSKDLLILQLIAILGTTRYGARTAILGDNVKNRVIAIGFSKSDKPVSSYTIMEELWNKKDLDIEKETIKQMQNSYNEDLIYGDDLEKFLGEVKEIMKNKEILKNTCKSIVKKMETDWEDFFK